MSQSLSADSYGTESFPRQNIYFLHLTRRRYDCPMRPRTGGGIPSCLSHGYVISLLPNQPQGTPIRAPFNARVGILEKNNAPRHIHCIPEGGEATAVVWEECSGPSLLSQSLFFKACCSELVRILLLIPVLAIFTQQFAGKNEFDLGPDEWR
jgi:hypothetical protein